MAVRQRKDWKMKCTNCGSDFASDQLQCLYCGTVNESVLKLAKEL